MSSFEIIGGQKLHGEITPQGAKNEALQIICAALLTPEKITIHNIPDIRDVNKLIELLAYLGVEVKKLKEGYDSLVSAECCREFIWNVEGKSVNLPVDEIAEVLCYGDSNTWGYVPGTGKRYSFGSRWPGILQKRLGKDVRVTEEGLNGRTTAWDDPLADGRNGKERTIK